MKRLLSVGLMLAMLLLSAGCSSTSMNAQGYSSGKRIVGSKRLVTKKISVDDFDRIVVQGSCKVVFTQKTGEPRAEIYGSDNLVDIMNVKVKDDCLIVSYKKGYSFVMNDGAKLELRVWAEAPDGVTLNGSGDVIFKNGIQTRDIDLVVNGSGDIEASKMKCNELKLTVNGSGDIDLEGIKATTVHASVNGSGDIELKGQCTEGYFSVNGSGDLTATSLKTHIANTSVSGSGDITCHVTDKLSARISGSGDIGYKGRPNIVKSPKKGLYQMD